MRRVRTDNNRSVKGEAWYLVLLAIGFALFDLGQLFARPMLSDLASTLDVTLVCSQALASILSLVFACVSITRASRGTDIYPIEFPLSACSALCCLLGVIVVLTAFASPGVISAFIANIFLGLSFGFSYVTWALLFCDRKLWLDQTTLPKHRAIALITALLISRILAGVFRTIGTPQTWVLFGIVCLIISNALLATLAWTLSKNAASRTTTDDPNDAPNDLVQSPGRLTGRYLLTSLRPHVSALLGAGLFALLFGLMTQVHNSSATYSQMPDYLSSIIVVVALMVLLGRVAFSQKALRMENVFLTTLPLIATVMVIAPLFWASMADIADALVKTFFSFYLVASIVYLTLDDTDKNTDFVCATLMAIIWICAAIGSAAGLVLVNVASDTAMTGVFLGATWVCMLAALLYARSRRSNDAVNTEPESNTAETIEVEKVVYVDRTEEQTRRLGRQRGLSDRECEVVSLLVKGRSAARIAEELVLSENTVKSHMQNIYAKLGIHTKQELVDLVGSIELDQADNGNLP